LFDEGDAETAGGGVERCSGAGDTTTDDHDVEQLVSHTLEVGLSLQGVQR
jgi:hypothetical protein